MVKFHFQVVTSNIWQYIYSNDSPSISAEVRLWAWESWGDIYPFTKFSSWDEHLFCKQKIRI